METKEPKKEITNEDIMNKVVDCFNKVFSETYTIRNDTYKIWDNMEPTYGNVRHLIDLNNKLDAKIEKLTRKVNDLQADLEKLNR